MDDEVGDDSARQPDSVVIAADVQLTKSEDQLHAISKKPLRLALLNEAESEFVDNLNYHNRLLQSDSDEGNDSPDDSMVRRNRVKPRAILESENLDSQNQLSKSNDVQPSNTSKDTGELRKRMKPLPSLDGSGANKQYVSLFLHT